MSDVQAPAGAGWPAGAAVRIASSESVRVTFEDVAGIVRVEAEINEVVDS
jgi:ATP-dependent Zn protease